MNIESVRECTEIENESMAESPFKAYKKKEIVNNPEELKGWRFTTRLLKAESGLGFALIGGSHPYEEFLQITYIARNSPAFVDGKLQKGDVLVRVNGELVLGYTFQDAIQLFETIQPGAQVDLEMCRGYPLHFKSYDLNNTEIHTTIDTGPYVTDSNTSNSDSFKENMLYRRGSSHSLNSLHKHVKSDNMRQGLELPKQTLYKIFTIDIVRSVLGFGFIVTDTAYGQKVEQILNRSGCKNLQEGDFIQQINNIDVAELNHLQVVRVLNDCPIEEETRIVVKREVRDWLDVSVLPKISPRTPANDPPQLLTTFKPRPLTPTRFTLGDGSRQKKIISNSAPLPRKQFSGDFLNNDLEGDRVYMNARSHSGSLRHITSSRSDFREGLNYGKNDCVKPGQFRSRTPEPAIPQRIQIPKPNRPKSPTVSDISSKSPINSLYGRFPVGRRPSDSCSSFRVPYTNFDDSFVIQSKQTDTSRRINATVPEDTGRSHRKSTPFELEEPVSRKYTEMQLPPTRPSCMSSSHNSSNPFHYPGNKEDNQKFIEINISLKGQQNGFGLQVIGGIEIGSQVVVAYIVPGGAADQDGRLRAGDEILFCDGVCVINASHHKVVVLMISAAARGQVSLGIRRTVPYTDTSIVRQGMEVITPRPTEITLQSTELSTKLSLEKRRKLLGHRSPKEACFYDGRLILLSNKDKNYIKRACRPTNEIGKGGFGTVYKQSNNGFGMQIAIKKITAKSEELDSARKEMFASRILHPFILPLLATFEEDRKNLSFDIFFISPYCANGDLNTVLKGCKKNPNICNTWMNQTQRIRICLQIALAIQYLHTPVPNVRSAILHKDISSVNIVLDKHLNARLIDFGLARENDDITSRCSGKIPYQHPDIGLYPASPLWDIYSFGVVIRELLTNLPPYGSEGVGLYLKHMPASVIEENLGKEWPTDDEDSLTNAKTLNIISVKCFKAKEGKFCTKTDVIDAIKSIFRQRIMVEPKKKVSKKCQSCMINPTGSEAARQVKHTSNCKETISLCIACEKNSFLNPVVCYSCGAKMEPIIGEGWGAILVAGNDADDDNNARAFKQDMEEVKRILVSRAPLIIGISQENVQTVAMEKPGRGGIGEKLLPRVEAAIEKVKKTNIHTLFVYFSCHGGYNEDNYFQLASKEEKLTIRYFQNMLASLSGVRKVIIILDRCFADVINVNGKSVVQINASRGNESAPVQGGGSPFTKYLIQGLKAESDGKECDLFQNKCKHCESFRATRMDYITVGSLLDYVAEHMASECHPEPYCLFKGTSSDEKLAYYTEEEVLVEFRESEYGRNTQNIKQLQISFCENMDELRKLLLQMFNKERTDLDVHIMNDTYRKDNRYENCNNIEEVMMAWVLRKPLIVQFSEKAPF